MFFPLFGQHVSEDLLSRKTAHGHTSANPIAGLWYGSHYRGPQPRRHSALAEMVTLLQDSRGRHGLKSERESSYLSRARMMSVACKRCQLSRLLLRGPQRLRCLGARTRGYHVVPYPAERPPSNRPLLRNLTLFSTTFISLIFFIALFHDYG